MTLANARAALNSGTRLALITAAVVGTLAIHHEITREPIERNQQLARVALLKPLIDDPRLATSLGTTPASDVRFCADGSEQFRLIRGAAEGYSGSIGFVIALKPDGTLLGVRIDRHTETPGLGDAIEPEHSVWIHQFGQLHRSLAASTAWRLKQDGGQFDAISGATITSRAVLGGVSRVLNAAPVTPTDPTDVFHIPCTPLR